jgi:hypothetical protein
MSIEMVPEDVPQPEPVIPSDPFSFLGEPAASQTAQDGADGGFFGAESAVPAPEKKTKRVAMSKKMKKSMDKLKAKVANIPIMWFHAQAAEHPEWELDEEEKDLLTDSIETVFEVLDIGIEIEPLSMTITSIWWVIGYPFAAFLFLFFTKKAQIGETEPKDGEQP